MACSHPEHLGVRNLSATCNAASVWDADVSSIRPQQVDVDIAGSSITLTRFAFSRSNGLPSTDGTLGDRWHDRGRILLLCAGTQVELCAGVLHISPKGVTNLKK